MKWKEKGIKMNDIKIIERKDIINIGDGIVGKIM